MPAASNLCDLLAASVDRTPNNLAVDHESGSLTYSELNDASDRLAYELQQNGVAPGDAVLLLTEHGARNVVALLAILKANACYVPLDRSSWSSERIDAVLEAVESRFLINTTVEPFDSSSHTIMHFRTLDITPSSTTKTILKPKTSIAPDALACLIFTSGSTGKPKGVMIPHRAVANYAQTSPFNMDVQSGDRVLHILSVSFDASTGMLFSILGNSGTVVPAMMDTLYDKAQTCTILASTPSILATLPLPSALPGSYPSVHTILLGGESPPTSLLASWLEKGSRILNAYGPTETTCASLMQEVEVSHETGSINRSIIGAPMKEGPVYLLTPDLDSVATNGDEREGEIVLAGIGLARGYYKNPTLTEKSFINWRGMRVYRTGDQGRWISRNDGRRVVEFRGRSDRTVKNRGFLVNLAAEVEEPLRRMRFGVTDVYATMVNGQLVALITPTTADLPGLRNEAQGLLSSFHVPDHFCAVGQFPLSPNGKIDTKAIEKLLEENQARMLATQVDIFSAQSPCDSVAKARLRPDSIIIECLYKALDLRPSSVSSSQKDINFFAMGGNSLRALRFTSLCREKGISITTRDLFLHPTVSGLLKCAGEIQRADSTPLRLEHEHVRQLRAEVAAHLKLGDIDALPSSIDIAPLTTLQLELSAAILESNGTNTNQLQQMYPLPVAHRVCDAWRQVCKRERAFRTQIALEIGPGVQIVHPLALCEPTEIIYHSRADYQAALGKPSSSALSVGLGMRLDFLKYLPTTADDDEGEVAIVWTVHHALIDGFSLGLVLAQVQQAIEGGPVSRASSFLDASWGLLKIQKSRDQEARLFWAEYLEPVRLLANKDEPTPVTIMPPVSPAYLAHEITFSHGDGLGSLQDLAATCKVTLATVYYTAWAMVLAKSTKTNLVTLKVAFSGREALPDFQDAIGPLMAILPMVCQLEEDATVEQQLQNTLKNLAVISAYSWCAPDQIGYRADSLMATQYDFPTYPQAITPRKERFFENTTFPLSLLVEADARFRLVYNPAVHTDRKARELAETFQSALNTLLQGLNVGQWLKKDDTRPENMHTNVQLAKITEATNVASVFVDSVVEHAQLIALEGPDGSLTYEALDQRSNAVANRISRQFPGAKVIAIHADGSMNWVVGILGILKAGCAYCPLDPAYPTARRIVVYQHSNADALLIPNSSVDATATLDVPKSCVLTVDEPDMRFESSKAQPSFLANACQDALIVFTSGTTGRPKGVPISHKGLLALQSNPEATMFSRPGRRIAQFMSPAFDYCANEIFSALLHGATLVLRRPTDPLAHLTQVDVSTITPSVLSVLDPADYPNLTMVYATGEPVTPGLVDRWASDRVFYNAYGPAECSICTSFTRLEPGQQVTIGRAIRTARMYILNSELQPVVDGQTGEIFLAGQQVMRGYLGDEDKTAYRVLPDPWNPGERMYRTGDYGYWSKDGQIVYIGRLDRQVKVRGFRVELAAVEQRMYQEEPRLTQAAALVVHDTLVAFVMPQSVDVRRLTQRLQDTLQPSWVPQVITALEELPWTPNRKVDFKSLEDMATLTRVDPIQGSEASPADLMKDSITEGISRIWKTVLRLEDEATLGAQEDFRLLGGHSILQMMLAARLGSKFGVSFSIRDIIEYPTLVKQAELVRRRRSQISPSERTAICDALPDHCLSTLERQTWFQYLVASDVRSFNIPVLLRLGGEFDAERFVSSMNAVLRSRKVFRTNFIETHSGPCRIFRDEPPQVRVCDLLDTALEIDRGFDLARDELIRVFLHQRTLLLVTSHAVADLNSVLNLLRETSAVYNGCSTPVADRWHYPRAPAWFRQTTDEERRFWSEYLDGAPQQLEIVRRPGQLTFEGGSRVSHFQGDLTKRLGDLTKHHGISQHQLVCAAVAQTLQWMTGTNDVTLGSPWVNRVLEVEQESMGLFLDRLPLRIKTPTNANASTILQSTQQASQKAVSYAIPFEQILNLLHLPRTIQRHPIFEAMVTFHLRGAVEECLSIDGMTVEREICFGSGAKFLLMFEWTEIAADNWVLRIEYDHNQIDHATISTIEEGVRIVLNGLVDDLPRPVIHENLNQSLIKGTKSLAVPINLDMQQRLVNILRREMAICLDVPLETFPCSICFFTAGGNSIHAWRLRRQLKRVGLDVPICKIFEYPTAHALAEYLGSNIC